MSGDRLRAWHIDEDLVFRTARKNVIESMNEGDPRTARALLRFLLNNLEDMHRVDRDGYTKWGMENSGAFPDLQRQFTNQWEKDHPGFRNAQRPGRGLSFGAPQLTDLPHPR